MPLFLKTFAPFTIAAATLSSFLLCGGCGEIGPPRSALWGNVTWKGQPVPRGIIFFGPNVSKGNSGPQGFALIHDGVFDTRQSPGKGCVAGPHIVQIHGCNGQNIRDERPYGDELFAPYETSLDVSAEAGEIDLIVPNTVQPIPPGANEPE
ncbi:MAG: hypothetical protein WD468_08870 [Pirellulales bacterium]